MKSAVKVFATAKVYPYPDRADVAGIKEVTGFEAKAANVATAEATPTEAGKKLGLVTPWGPRRAIRPLFSVRASADETLATYSDGTPAVALRRSERGIDVFVGVPQLTPELVRTLAKAAGAHLFIEGKATVAAAGGSWRSPLLFTFPQGLRRILDASFDSLYVKGNVPAWPRFAAVTVLRQRWSEVMSSLVSMMQEKARAVASAFRGAGVDPAGVPDQVKAAGVIVWYGGAMNIQSPLAWNAVIAGHYSEAARAYSVAGLSPPKLKYIKDLLGSTPDKPG